MSEECTVTVPVGSNEYRIPYRDPDHFTLEEFIEMERIMLFGKHTGAEASLLALQVLARMRKGQRVNVEAHLREAVGRRDARRGRE